MGLYNQQGSCDVIRILDERITKEIYLDILRNELIARALRNLVLLTRLIWINSITRTNTIKRIILNINLIYVSRGYYTTVPKLLILLTKVLILTLPNICGFIERISLDKRLPTNKNELISFIKEEWGKIPSEYDIPKLIQSMRRHILAVIDILGEHTKY